LNVAGILVGTLGGLVRPKPFSAAQESYLKVALGAFTVYYGLRLTWLSLGGSFSQILLKVLIAILALMLGRLTGRLLRLQKASNRLGQYARSQIGAARPDDPRRLGAGFKTCAALFCAAPLGIIGSILDGLSGYFCVLGIKAVMDGLACRGFVASFGWGVLLSALPVLALQGTLTLLSAWGLKPILESHSAAGLSDSLNAVAGLLVFSVALVILGLKKIELADYLPSLAFAPLLSWLFH
jgi:uncharacterized membrane protein YqgA involved in biofilm formation